MSDFALDVQLGTIPLRIISDKDGIPQYEEEEQVGGDVADKADQVQFVDVFNTWHKGGFVREHVQNGYYFMAENVWCGVPGQIKPAPKRITQVNLNGGGAGINHYGPAALAFDDEFQYLLIVGREEALAADNRPNRLRIYALDSAHARVAGDGDLLSSDARDQAAITSISHVRMDRIYHPAIGKVWLIPTGTQTNMTRYTLSTMAVVAMAIPALGVLHGAGRLYRLLNDAQRSVTLSNCDINADPSLAANWTTPVVYHADGLGPRKPYTWSLGTLDGVPLIGTVNGIYALGPDGIPYNMTPQFEFIPQPGNFGVLRVGSQGRLISCLGSSGELRAFNRSGSARYGPGVENPLAVMPKNVEIQDIYEAPNGNLWVYVRLPDGWSAEADGGGMSVNITWQMWVGVPNPQGGYAWHQVWTEVAGTNETIGTGAGQDSFPCLPIPWATPEFVVPGPSGDNLQKVTFLDGGLFFNKSRTYQHEDNTVGYNMVGTVRFYSGFYSRHDPRVNRHWTKIRFRGENLGAAGVAGGRVLIGYRLNPADAFTSLGYMTANSQSFTINAVGRKLEYEALWQLDGVNAATMRDTPATITQVEVFGREIPGTLRIISLLVDGDSAALAGGVRRQQGTRDLLKDLAESSANNVDLTFRDPFRESRTVQLLTGSQRLSLSECRRLKIPESTVRITLLETLEPSG